MRRKKDYDHKAKNLKTRKSVYAIFIGLALMVWEIMLYRKTLIPLYVPVLVITVTGSLTYFLIKNHYKRTYQLDGEFMPVIQSFLSVGFISCFLFMAANYYLADDENVTKKEFRIVEKSEMSGSRRGFRSRRQQPLIKIHYKGREHNLVFGSGFRKQAKDSDRVELTLKPGLFGFEVIEKQTLIPQAF